MEKREEIRNLTHAEISEVTYHQVVQKMLDFDRVDSRKKMN